MESGDARKLKQLEEENRKLKHVVAELTLDDRTARLQAGRVGVIDAPISVTESRSGRRTANATEGAGGKARAIWLSAAHRNVGAIRNAGKPQECMRSCR